MNLIGNKILLVAVALVGAFFFREPILNYLAYWEERLKIGSVVSELPKVNQADLDSVVKRVQKQVTSQPLRAKTEAKEAVLTKAGIIAWTNIQRKNNGLPPLQENAKLNAAAMAKVNDMFAKQYFDHISPTGQGPSDLARDAGYQFIVVGENLALGNFKNDEVLVQGWMDSPGHRANILNNKFREIGVAVLKGTFEGRTTWMAVQEFGLPLTACPAPTTTVRNQIQSYESQAENLQVLIEAKREEIENTHPKRGPEYNAKIQEYNELVNDYNAIVEELKRLIQIYNDQVNAFNYCLEQLSG